MSFVGKVSEAGADSQLKIYQRGGIRAFRATPTQRGLRNEPS
jgi:hypothetical protein